MDFVNDMGILLLGIIIGVSSTLWYKENQSVFPIETYLQASCIKIGSELKSYTTGGEIICENGARFNYYHINKPL
ncbi:MAG: hypothetical protein GOVbin2917_141 [Prokaryotic dsDNA virus sp.]|jgi:hypothetical protein|nr:MAG: hypothetical protein GOVbin2917_141 [Prokaryotic dsDNA virus sp.]